jgi:oligopeptide/dipeptide ABC transporter ATP-binding protein
MAGDVAVSVRDLRVFYGSDRGPVRAVDRVDLDLRKGQTIGLVGESGCGKSTLGRAMMGLFPSGAGVDGQVLVGGSDILTMKPKQLEAVRGARIAMIFQEPMTRLNPLMRISAHFREMLRVHERGISDVQVKSRSLEILAAMGIPPTRFNNYPHEFSGGMRQRIMIALALVLKPDVIIADEPTTALDVLVEAQIVQILSDLRENFDTSLLLITHSLGIVAEACNTVAVMYAGRIVEQGPVRQVFAHPGHPYTSALLNSTISTSTTKLQTIPGSTPDLVEPPSGCRFHPRCGSAMHVCTTSTPPLLPSSVGEMACWLGAAHLAPDQSQFLQEVRADS